jgi:hypothetical protein
VVGGARAPQLSRGVSQTGAYVKPIMMVAMLAGLACTAGTQEVRRGEQVTRASEPGALDAIREVVLRDLMSHDSDQTRAARTSTCFISFEERLDPPQEFLDRLTGACAAVRPWSQLAAAGGPIRFSESAGTRIGFNVGSIRWRSESEAEVQAGYNCGSLCAAAYTYRVRSTRTGWVVAQVTMQWIS